MPDEFRHYRALARQLGKHADAGASAAILLGMDTVKKSASPEARARWASEITQRLDENLDEQTRIRVREGCACLVSNKDSIYAKTFRRLRKQYPDDYEYLVKAMEYLDGTRPLRRCGEVSVRDGRVHAVIARGACVCPCIGSGLTGPISKTWCHCCKGCLLGVFEQVFPGKQCHMEIEETVASGGMTCTFTVAYT